MVSHLIRSNAHSSETFVSIVYKYDSNPVWIRKASSTKVGIERLKNEVKGVEWYKQVSETAYVPCHIIDRQEYFSVQFNFICGEKIDYSRGFSENKRYIERVLDEYCKVWSKIPDGSNVVHGDLSLDNVLFSDDGVVIIDWEHFSNTSIPVGFDMLNLVYEQLYMLSLRNSIGTDVVESVKEMLAKLCVADCMDETFFGRPLKILRQFILGNGELWGEQLNKLPVLKFTERQVDELDSMIFFE